MKKSTCVRGQIHNRMLSVVAIFLLMSVFDADSLVGQQDKNQEKERIRILFLGNSHTQSHGVPGLVEQLIESSGKYQVTKRSFYAPFLEDLSNRRNVTNSIKNGNWDFVIMQGQKISMSGRYKYSTEGASKLSNLTKSNGAKTIWFCEWSRKGIVGELERIQEIYEGIAAPNGDTLAPVGSVWSAALQAKKDELSLHANDGNHANIAGAYLAALTLYSTVTRSDCRELPRLRLSGVSEELQSFLKDITYAGTLHLLEDHSIEDMDVASLAIQRVLRIDARLSDKRNNASRKHSLHTAVAEYVKEMKSIDYSNCPPEFAASFASHLNAWAESLAFFESHRDLRGEMHELFTQIKSKDGNAKAELELIEKKIWNSWDDVEKVTQKFKN